MSAYMPISGRTLDAALTIAEALIAETEGLHQAAIESGDLGWMAHADQQRAQATAIAVQLRNLYAEAWGLPKRWQP